MKNDPDKFEEEDMKALEDQYEGQRINAFDAVKVKTESEDFEDDKFKEDNKALDDQGEVERTNSFLFS